MFPILILITMKKDLSIFMKVGSFGVIFILFLIFFIITVGIEAFGNTDFVFGTAEESNNTDWLGDQRTLVTFNLNFAPLAGNLCTGYFLHTCSLSVLRSSKNPEKTHRDLFLGYVLVFISYATVGLFGYFGFISTAFSQYFVNEEGTSLHGQIAQNCLMMFNYKSPYAFLLRLAVFTMIFSTYPLVQYFLTQLL